MSPKRPKFLVTEWPNGVIQHEDTLTQTVVRSWPDGRKETFAAGSTEDRRYPISAKTMPKLTIVIGGNGAENQHGAPSQRKHLPKHFYNADSIARGLGDWNDPDLQKDAREVVDRKIEKHLERKEEFGSRARTQEVKTVDRETGRQKRIRSCSYIRWNKSHKINIARVARRVSDGTGHKVPKSEIVRRWTVAQDNLATTARYMTSIELLDNSSTSWRQVGMLARDTTRTWGKDQPDWATKLTEKIVRTDPTLAGPSQNSQHKPNTSQQITRNRTTHQRGRRRDNIRNEKMRTKTAQPDDRQEERARWVKAETEHRMTEEESIDEIELGATRELPAARRMVPDERRPTTPAEARRALHRTGRSHRRIVQRMALQADGNRSRAGTKEPQPGVT